MDWSKDHYSLIVNGNTDDSIFSSRSGWSSFPKERLFEWTNDDLKATYEQDLSKLIELPAVILAERYGQSKRPAFITRIDKIIATGPQIRFRFEHLFDRISSEQVFECGYFDVDTSTRGISEPFRTHWAVKQGNLVEGLLHLFMEQPKPQPPKAFKVQEWPLPTLGHVAVMMPFDNAFDPVYEAIKSACKSERLEPRRVDQIYTPTPVIDDVFAMIAQSVLVICDLTDRNANVLYEAGLAHALDREVIIIAQDSDDVPFNLQHIRYFPYLRNTEGLSELTKTLSNTLRSIRSSN